MAALLVRAAIVVAPWVCALWGGMAHAQTSDPRERALELFRESAEHYRAGRFEEAAALLTEAYELRPEPVLLYNLARALEGAGELEGAADAYRRYLAADPDTTDREAVARRLETLDRLLAERAALSEEARRGRDVAPPPQRPIDPLPWVITGVGGGTLIAAAVTGGLAMSRHTEAEREPVHAVAAQREREAQDLATATNVLAGVGGALSIAGLVWGLIDVATRGAGTPPRSSSSDGTVRLDVGAGGVSVSGTF